MRRRRMSKDKAERRHAFARFAERFGCGLSNETYNEMIRQIQDGRATFLHKQSNRVTVWRLIYEGKFVRVAYDRDRHNIVTFMPEENENMAHPNEPKVAELETIRTDLYKQECTVDVSKKIAAIEAQIKRRKEEAKAEVGLAGVKL